MCLAALESVDGWSGRILQVNESCLFLEERVPSASQVLPAYIASLSSPYTEETARCLFRRLVELVSVVHMTETAHRHLHLNQIVVDPAGQLRLRGLRYAVATSTGPGSELSDYQNQPDKLDYYAFTAPEFELGGQGVMATQIDSWSVGCCLYMMLTGLPPFRGTRSALQHAKHTGQVAPYDMVVPSQEAQQVVQGLLQVDPAERWTVGQALDHPWLADESADYGHYDLSLARTFLQDWGTKAPVSSSPSSSRPRERRQHHRPTEILPPVVTGDSSSVAAQQQHQSISTLSVGSN
jgi:serine/threonine protein kinase